MIRHCFRLMVIAALSVLITSCASAPEQSLYEEIGGHKTLNTIYGVAITRIYTDPVIGHYFKGVPKKTFKRSTCIANMRAYWRALRI